MNWIKQQNFLAALLIGVVSFSLLFCCGAAWHNVLSSANSDMEGHSACGMSDMAGDSGGSTNYMTTASLVNSFRNFFLVLTILLSAIFFVTIKKNDVTYYFRNIRCRYGGFNVFDYFINLFSVGILNPKVF